MELTFLQNNIALVLAAVVSGGMLLWSALSRRGNEINTLIAVQLINYKDALVLDVREGSEYDAGHLADSKHIPGDKLEDRIQELEKYKSKPIILIHRSGMNTTGKAGSILSKHGFAHVHNLAGGIDTWRQANLPIVKK